MIHLSVYSLEFSIFSIVKLIFFCYVSHSFFLRHVPSAMYEMNNNKMFPVVDFHIESININICVYNVIGKTFLSNES